MPTFVPDIHQELSIRRNGVIIAIIIAIAAKFISEHYGAPAMLMALLFGMSLSFLSEEISCAPGIAFTSKTLLRIGVAFLGVRVSVASIVDLGTAVILLVILGVVSTIAFGLVAARLLGRTWSFGMLTGGAVAICGASAAMAISAVLPKNERSENNLIFTVLGVTLLSTVAMIVYPILSVWFGLDNKWAGIFLGGTIHDVAQVVGAGFSVSQETGEVATLVKLIRVSLLAPTIFICALTIRSMSETPPDGKRPPILPGFVFGFLTLAALNSFSLVPVILSEILAEASGWALLTAIAAVGLKTSLKPILEVGRLAILLLIGETVFLCTIFLLGMSRL